MNSPLPTAVPIRWPAWAAGAPPATLAGVGDPALLTPPLLGLLASRACPAAAMLDTLALVPGWVAAGRVLLSGFHSPLEQQVLRSLLRRDGRAVKLLARGILRYHPPPEERPALEAGRLLVLSPFAPSMRRITRASALARNRLVIALADELLVPCESHPGALSPAGSGPTGSTARRERS